MGILEGKAPEEALKFAGWCPTCLYPYDSRATPMCVVPHEQLLDTCAPLDVPLDFVGSGSSVYVQLQRVRSVWGALEPCQAFPAGRRWTRGSAVIIDG